MWTGTLLPGICASVAEYMQPPIVTVRSFFLFPTLSLFSSVFIFLSLINCFVQRLAIHHCLSSDKDINKGSSKS